MGRLSKRTIQCRAARKQRDLNKDPLATSLKVPPRGSIMKAYGSVVDFNKLGEDSLQRYQQVYGLGATPESSKEELAWAVKHHFQYQEVVDECSLLYGFAQAVRRDSSSESSLSS